MINLPPSRWRSWSSFRRLFSDSSGGIMTMTALMLPVALAAVGLSLDFVVASTARQQLQSAADAAALAGAKELSLSDVNHAAVANVARTVVGTLVRGERVEGARVTAEVSDEPISVTVWAEKQLDMLFGDFIGQPTVTVAAHSVARVLGKPNICILGLDDGSPGTIGLDNRAEVVGRNCSVFSNSKSSAGLKANGNSLLSASFVCSAGGVGGKKSNIHPTPLEDCPQFDDPLADQPEPPVGPCTHDNLVVSASMNLSPGTYCGGLSIGNGAEVLLEPGVYVIKDGPLTINGNAKVQGRGVGFHLVGDDAELDIASDSVVALEAGLDGEMAGLLVFEARSQSTAASHSLMSDDAQVMVGTIYLPQGRLLISGSSKVGGQSAYTAIVARTLEVADGPTIVLNTDYDATDVPVPDGIRGAGEPATLVE